MIYYVLDNKKRMHAFGLYMRASTLERFRQLSYTIINATLDTRQRATLREAICVFCVLLRVCVPCRVSVGRGPYARPRIINADTDVGHARKKT